MAMFVRARRGVHLEHELPRAVFDIEDARGKLNGYRALCELFHLKHYGLSADRSPNVFMRPRKALCASRRSHEAMLRAIRQLTVTCP
jgi:hypothetical protein